MTTAGEDVPRSMVRRAPGRFGAAVMGLVLLASLVATTPVYADRRSPMAPDDVAKLVSVVKSAHPNASILKIEREHSKHFGGADVYEVKLLRPDGQVLKLYYDPATLAPMARHDDHDRGDDDDRHRERTRNHW